VYLYQSGVGFVASGTVEGDLEKSDYDGITDAKYSKKLKALNLVLSRFLQRVLNL